MASARHGDAHRCWCGGEDLSPFGEHYLSCADCETLIAARFPEVDPTRVRDEERDFYGRRYWFEHQRDLDQPDLVERSVGDLGERCLHWLRAALKYRLPSGRTLEIGCSHGGFVALLRQAGFEAMGLELSPWVIDFARRTFAVAVARGPLEDQDFEPGSFDLIVALDVLEHLPDPAATLGRAVELLTEDGLLLVQTPCRPAGRSHRQLAADGDRFLEMMLPDEHLYLFSREGVSELCRRLGDPHLRFEPAIFGHYDMFFVAGRRPFRANPEEAVREVLSAIPERRPLQALLDLYWRSSEQAAAYAEADADRRARQDQIEDLQRLLAAAGEEQEETRESLDRLHRLQERSQRGAHELHLKREKARGEVDELHRDRETSQRTIAELQREREELRQQVRELHWERSETRKEVDKLHREREDAARKISEFHQEKVQHEERIERLHRQRSESDSTIAGLRQQQAVLRCQQAGLEEEIESRRAEERRLKAALGEERSAGDRMRREIRDLEDRASSLGGEAARLRRERDDLGELQRHAAGTVERQEAAQATALAEIDRLRARSGRVEEWYRELRGVVEEYRTSRIYRGVVGLGRWRPYDAKLRRILDLPSGTMPAAADGVVEHTWQVPSAGSEPPRGEGWIAVDLTALLPGGENGGAKVVATELVRAMSRLRPERSFLLITSEPCHRELEDLDGPNVQKVRVRPDAGTLGAVMRHSGAGGTPALPAGPGVLPAGPSVLFCPMTAPSFADPRLPLISVVHDLQYQAFPEFFAASERVDRDRDFRRVAEQAARVVTVSEFVRRTVLESSDLDGDRVVAVPHGLAGRFPEPSAAEVDAVLERHGLERERYLLYPANFWPHKNHRMLLVAFNIFRNRAARETKLKLVLTGAERPDPEPLRDAARRMDLGDEAVFAGFVSDRELAALLVACRALVFPSLYEGFGMPVVEAMACSRSVLCGDAASLPEVTGGAALMFDPRKLEGIAAAIERLETEPGLAERLGEQGRQRLEKIGDVDRMAGDYLDVLEEVLASPPPIRDELCASLHADLVMAVSEFTRWHFLETFPPLSGGAHRGGALGEPLRRRGARRSSGRFVKPGGRWFPALRRHPRAAQEPGAAARGVCCLGGGERRSVAAGAGRRPRLAGRRARPADRRPRPRRAGDASRLRRRRDAQVALPELPRLRLSFPVRGFRPAGGGSPEPGGGGDHLPHQLAAGGR